MVYGLWFLISVWCIFLVFYFAFGLSVSGVCFFLVWGNLCGEGRKFEVCFT
jgi:hypothetical protein